MEHRGRQEDEASKTLSETVAKSYLRVTHIREVRVPVILLVTEVEPCLMYKTQNIVLLQTLNFQKSFLQKHKTEKVRKKYPSR